LAGDVGSEAGKEWSTDGEHWVAVKWRSCARCQGRSCQDRLDKSSLYRSWRKDCAKQTSREALEV